MTVGQIIYNPAIASHALIGAIAIAEPKISEQTPVLLSSLEHAATRLAELGTGNDPAALKVLEAVGHNPIVREALARHTISQEIMSGSLSEAQFNHIDRIAGSLISGTNLMTGNISDAALPLGMLKAAMLVTGMTDQPGDYPRLLGDKPFSFEAIFKHLLNFRRESDSRLKSQLTGTESINKAISLPIDNEVGGKPVSE